MVKGTTRTSFNTQQQRLYTGFGIIFPFFKCASELKGSSLH